MAIKEMRPGRIEVEVSNLASLNTTPQAQDLPGGLYPLQTRAYEMDDYRVRLGWPVSPPMHDIRATSLVSCTGETFSTRDDNTAVRTGAVLRWVADSTTYNEVGLRWDPIQDATGGHPYWTAPVDNLPVLINDYEYRVKDERFKMSALNFDSDTANYLTADFTSTLGGATGYTVIMVMSPNSVYGNDVSVPYNGLWCPVEESGTWSSVTIQGGYLWLETESDDRKSAIAITPELNSNAPLYLAIVFGRPETVFYAGTGPDEMRVKSVVTYDNVGLMSNEVFLGRSEEDLLHTADMALFDLNLYADRLTASEIKNEFSLLARAYGGNE